MTVSSLSDQMSIQSPCQPQMGQSSDLGEDFDFVSETSFDLPESRIAPPPPLLAKRRHAEMGYHRALVDQQTQAQSLPLFGLLGSGAGGGGGHGGGYGGGGGCSLSLPNLCQLLALGALAALAAAAGAAIFLAVQNGRRRRRSTREVGSLATLLEGKRNQSVQQLDMKSIAFWVNSSDITPQKRVLQESDKSQIFY